MRYLEARVNGGSNYDSLKIAKCLVIQLVTRMNGLTRYQLSLNVCQRYLCYGNGPKTTAGKEVPFELNSRSLVGWFVGCSISGRHFGFEIPLLIELFGLTYKNNLMRISVMDEL